MCMCSKDILSVLVVGSINFSVAANSFGWYQSVIFFFLFFYKVYYGLPIIAIDGIIPPIEPRTSFSILNLKALAKGLGLAFNT